MSNQQYSTPLPKTAFNEYKIRLLAPKPDGQRRAPSLTVAVIRNNPRIDVYTEVEGDKDRGKITAPMDSVTFFALMDILEKTIDGPADEQTKISNKVGPPQDKRQVSTTIVGKDKEGRVFISLVATERPKVKFVFLPSDWHTLVHKDGSPYTEAELSMVYARAWLRLMSNLVPAVLDTHFMEPEPRENKGGKWNGGNKGYRAPAPSVDFDDDFPM